MLKKEKFVEHEGLRDKSVETRQYQIKILDVARKKNTLVVRFGSVFGQVEFAFCLIAPLVVSISLVFFFHGPVNLIGVFFLFPIVVRLIRTTFTFQNPAELIPVLQGTSLLFFFYTLLFCISYVW